MRKRSETWVYFRDGARGVIEAWQPDSGAGAHALVSDEQGGRAWLPVSALVAQADGSYVLPIERRHLTDAQAVIPVMAEEVRVERRVVETARVRLRKVVHEREEEVSPEVTRETVSIERVPVGRFVDGPVASRQEGDTLVVPVLEEVLVVERRLRLVEEIRVTVRRERHASEPQRVTLRREEVLIERDEAPREPT